MAPKKKGGKKAKEKIDESPEERMARLEKEAYEVEERERVQTEANRLSLRARQLREQQYSKCNGIKIHNQWRKIMRMAKVDHLRRQIEILSQNHEREVDRKDAIIQMLNRDLEDADEQYETALRGHLRVVDNMLDLQYQRMKAIDESFQVAVAALEHEFETERIEITNAHNKHKKDMHDMRVAMEGEHQDAENEVRQEFEAQREEIKNKNSEDYNVLKISLETGIDDLEKFFEQAHTAYLQSTEQHTNTFRELTKNDAKAARVIEMRMRKLQRLQEALKHWRVKIQSNSREWEERNRSLFNEKQIMNKHYQALKSSMDSFRTQQSERLKQLSLQSGDCCAELNSTIARAENMLKLAEMCRKLETEQEKILPFHGVSQAVRMDGESNDLADVELELQALRPSEPNDADGKPGLSCKGLDETGRVIDEWDYLNKFFRRYNKAMLDKAAIDREALRLTQENDDLRAILKQYLDGISVNEDVMNNPLNPLLVVNNRLQLTLSERDKARKVILERHIVQQQMVYSK